MHGLTDQERRLVEEALARRMLLPEDLDAARRQVAAEGGGLFDRVRARMRSPAPPKAPPGPVVLARPSFGSSPDARASFGSSPDARASFGSSPDARASFGSSPDAGRAAFEAKTAAWAPDALPPEEAKTAAWGPDGPVDPPPGDSALTVAGPLDPAPAPSPRRPRGDEPPREGWVGDYELVRELARGGMGVVYVARSAQLGRDVALKMLLPGEADEVALERFRIEARAAARLRHPNIVGLHHVGEDAGRPYMVMDLIPGKSLKARLDESGPLDMREAARLTAGLADALGYAHERAILHRDVKPHNVLLGAKGEPILTDFGLAKEVSGKKEGVTVTGEAMGTPAYMPPEQAGGDVQAIDRRADVYSLGATLYHLLTGQAPFEGTPVQIITAVLAREPVRPRARRPDLDPDLETICLTCMEKEPERRYRTMADLHADLTAYLEDRPIRARPPTPLARLAKWRRRNPTLARVVIGAATLLALGGGLGVAQAASARVEAARREASAGARERAALTDRARARAQDAARALAAAPLVAGDDDALALRSARALEAYVAAQRWHGLAPLEPDAARGLYAAATAFGEVSAAARQWLLASQTFEEAARLGVDDGSAKAGAAKASEALREERLAAERLRRDREERARSIDEALADAAAGRLHERRAAFEQAVYRVARAAREDTLPRLLDRLERVVAALERAEREALAAAMTEGGASEELRREVAQAVVARTDPALPPERQEEELERWRQAGPYVMRWASRRPGVGGRAGSSPVMILGFAQTEALGDEVHVARLLTAALAQVGEDERVAPALLRYLARECDMERATRPAVALCLMAGPGEAEAARQAQAVRLALARFPSGAAIHDEVGHVLALVPGLLEARAEDTLEAAQERARLLSDRRDHRGALREIEDALARHPDAPPEFRLNRAVALKLVGDHAGAAAECTAILEALPGDPRAQRERALARRALKDLAGARADLEEVLRRDPGDGAAWLVLAAVRHDSGDGAGAIEAFSRCLELDPQNVEALANRGLLRSTLDPAAARRDVDEALRLSPQNVQALTISGDLLRDARDLAGAVAAYTRAIDVVPSSPHIWVRRAEVRLSAGDAAGARADIDHALRLGPSGPVEDAARRVLARLDGSAPGTAGAERSGAALLRRAQEELRAGRLDAARRAADEACAARPDDPRAWELAAHTRHLGGDLDGAVAAYTKALALAPQARTYANRGSAYLAGLQSGRAGWGERARADLEQATSLDPGLGSAWGNLGVLRAQAGDLDGAITALERAIELLPDDPNTPRSRQLVEQLRQRRGR